MMRDKNYIRIDNDWLFNVTGDEHPEEHVYASLKYHGGQKWTQGYNAAVGFLREHEPSFIDADGYISVPRHRISEVLDPFDRWHALLQQSHRSALHQEAVDLASKLTEILGLNDFGITDSLLWGDGRVDSDIDLVVRGRRNAKLFFAKAAVLYQNTEFDRPAPDRLHPPSGTNVPNWPDLLQRKLHMGCFRGRFFSLRVVLANDELEFHPWQPTGRRDQLHFRIADSSDSLLFPCIYRNEQGDELVDYSVVFEGVFRPHELVHCACEHLVARAGGENRNRYVLKQVISVERD